MSAFWIEILIIFALILLNGVLAMTEIAVVSARKVRLKQMAELGDRGAATALELAQDPAQFLSAVQIGITLVGILAGVFGGATVAGELELAIKKIPALADYSETIALTFIVLVISYLTLVVGELGLRRDSHVVGIPCAPVAPLDLCSRFQLWHGVRPIRPLATFRR
jgi:putative hemolysin